MAVRLATATRNAMVDAWAALANGGTIQVRTGAQPATAETAATGTLLATLAMTTPAFAPAANGSADIDADPDLEATAVADGTAGWARVLNSTGGTVFDGSVGTTAADFLINATEITTGGIVRLLSGSITQPAG